MFVHVNLKAHRSTRNAAYSKAAETRTPAGFESPRGKLRRLPNQTSDAGSNLIVLTGPRVGAQPCRKSCRRLAKLS